MEIGEFGWCDAFLVRNVLRKYIGQEAIYFHLSMDIPRGKWNYVWQTMS